jgi:hypothetical protein
MAAAFSKGRVIAAGCSGCDDSTFVGRTGRANRQYQLATTGSSGTGTGTDRHGTAQPPPLRARGASRNGLWSRWSPLLPSHPRTETRARAQRQKPAAPRAAPFCSPWPRCFCEPSPPNAAQRCPGSSARCVVRGAWCAVLARQVRPTVGAFPSHSWWRYTVHSHARWPQTPHARPRRRAEWRRAVHLPSGLARTEHRPVDTRLSASLLILVHSVY